MIEQRAVILPGPQPAWPVVAVVDVVRLFAPVVVVEAERTPAAVAGVRQARDGPVRVDTA